MDVATVIEEKERALVGRLDAATLRLWAAVEARALGHGGVSAVAQASGLSRTTLYAGLRPLDAPTPREVLRAGGGRRIRAPGGGRKQLTVTAPTLLSDLDALVEPTTRGEPRSPWRWTCQRTPRLARELAQRGPTVSQRSVCARLAHRDDSLQATRKTREGGKPPDRDAHCSHLAARVAQYQRAGEPVISVDPKQKEARGDFKNGGRAWPPKGAPESVRVYDLIDPVLGKVAPYGVYDVGANQGWVSVGITHDTAAWAVETMRRWWREMGQPLYPPARRLRITAAGGGSNGYRVRWWRFQLQKLADARQMTIQVCHFPPGTRQGNKIEPRMCCHLTQHWRGRPLIRRQVVVNLIGSATTPTGLRIQAAWDENTYALGSKVSEEERATIAIERDEFHGEWNYRLKPRSPKH